MQNVFLSAAWRRLIMLNYPVDPAVLQAHVPKGTELDIWNGVCYVSVVGFMFMDTRLKGFRIPGHINFEEINLRFYVRRNDPVTGWKRGVVFIREIVPRPAIAWVANTIYGEHYDRRNMFHRWHDEPEHLEVEYAWQEKGRWQSFGVRAEPAAVPLKAGSEAEFITEHYWGYARRGAERTVEYQVEHPAWRMHPIKAWHCDLDFGMAYGSDFSHLGKEAPMSIFLAEGSEVVVRGRKFLQC